jgi:predicted nucleic acid-binding protein
MDSFVTDTQALVKFMMGKKVINEQSHQAYQSADRGETIIIIPAVVLMEMLYFRPRNVQKTVFLICNIFTSFDFINLNIMARFLPCSIS